MHGQVRGLDIRTAASARAAWVLFVLVVPACAAFGGPISSIIEVPNSSFETPLAPRVPPYARPAFGGPDEVDWQKTPIPDWWTFGPIPWDQSGGVFFNVLGSLHIDNAVGEQVVFLFGTPDLGIFQDLAATYEVGRSYHLSVAIRGGSTGMPLDSPIEVSLYYRDDDDVQVLISATEFLNDNLGSPTSLLDVVVETPVVGPNDAWACRNIGISLMSTVLLEEQHLQGGTWGIDNVRLNAHDADRAAEDLDIDGKVDLLDYGHFPSCMTDPNQIVTCCNRLSDVDNDGDADLEDFSLLSAAFTVE